MNKSNTQLKRSVVSPARNTKRMRIILEIDCDDTSAMFRREVFNKRALELAQLWNDPSSEKKVGSVLGGPVRYVATEEVE